MDGKWERIEGEGEEIFLIDFVKREDSAKIYAKNDARDACKIYFENSVSIEDIERIIERIDN